ncbi:GNAT family N-acetyltransferase [Streptomyces sp. RKND-216]|uniref:GNAT family N-acetyltransferase n=1 Tax=Streptomyces sp. RKND-216 TaxID=2562581 RepID=UPI00109E13EE|nr:GNAT family N-acetyltransferase [Streptomyces sp. RKND-216]THA25733.1 GNAT family N-acetyltransferase [Streptomyces sp. RKND-216]
MTPEIRTLTADDLPAWFRAVHVGFLNGKELTDEEIAVRGGGVAVDRTQGAFDGGRCVGTFRTMPQQLTVPGGAALPSCAVTNVTVSPTHRRRGLLTRMMGEAMAAAKERGDAVASLIAAEYPIYGHHGFGPAAWTTEFTVDVPRTGLNRRYAGPPQGEGRVDLVEPDAFRRVAPEFHERFRVQPHRQGVIDRNDRWWRMNTGELRWPDDEWEPPFCAVFRDTDGVVQGTVTYTAQHDNWHNKLPHCTLSVGKLEAATPQAERALWHFLLSVDWVTTLRSGYRAPDDVLPLLLPDPRAARIDAHADFLWLRPLDVPRMLAARTYAVPGTLVLDLHDETGLADGRFRLETGPEGAACTRAGEGADLSMDIAALGTLYLGDETATRLAALGRVVEHTPGAAAKADALFRTTRRPWCPDVF